MGTQKRQIATSKESGTILSGVDTEGMSKAQKKKLKTKLKKQMGHAGGHKDAKDQRQTADESFD